MSSGNVPLVLEDPHTTGKRKAGSGTSWMFQGQVIVAQMLGLQLLPLFRACTAHELLPSVVQGKDNLLWPLGWLHEQQTWGKRGSGGMATYMYLSLLDGTLSNWCQIESMKQIVI